MTMRTDETYQYRPVFWKITVKIASYFVNQNLRHDLHDPVPSCNTPLPTSPRAQLPRVFLIHKI